jgi:hypothetical protein
LIKKERRITNWSQQKYTRNKYNRTIEESYPNTCRYIQKPFPFYHNSNRLEQFHQ